MVLQSCYKRVLTTLCTRERRDRKPLRLNVLVSNMRLASLGPSVTLKNTESDAGNHSASTNCGTIENKYELVAPNIRRTLFQFAVARAFS